MVASKNPAYYPTLISGVEWWLPLENAPVVFAAPTPAGFKVTMGSVRQLVRELEEFITRHGWEQSQLEQDFQDGPRDFGKDVNAAARYGAAVLFAATRHALAWDLPLLLDY